VGRRARWRRGLHGRSCPKGGRESCQATQGTPSREAIRKEKQRSQPPEVLHRADYEGTSGPSKGGPPALPRDGDPELVRWGDWGWAVRLTLRYQHPQTGETVRIDETVRVPRLDDFRLHIGASGTVQCRGFLPNGRLRHPMWMGGFTPLR
jgi:hypothetical protein